MQIRKNDEQDTKTGGDAVAAAEQTEADIAEACDCLSFIYLSGVPESSLPCSLHRKVWYRTVRQSR